MSKPRSHDWAASDSPDPATTVVHALRRVSFAYGAVVTTAAASSGLHPTDLRALAELLDARRGGMVEPTPSWLGRRLAMRSPAITALLGRLERHRLIAREPAPSDRRRTRLVVTDDAVEIGWAAFGPTIERLLEALGKHSESELVAAERVLRSAVAALERSDIGDE